MNTKEQNIIKACETIPVGVAFAMPVDHMESLKEEIHLEVELQMARNLKGVAHLKDTVLKMVQEVA